MTCTAHPPRLALPARAHRLLALLTASSALLSPRAHAQAADLVFGVGNVDVDPSPPDPDSIGRGVASVALDVPILDTDSTFRNHQAGAGFNVVIVGGREGWPAMIGFGTGIMLFDGTGHDGPRVTTVNVGDGGLGVSVESSYISRTLELRHAEVVVRVQPWWGVARPFVEVAAGVGALWISQRWETSGGQVLDLVEQNRAVGGLFGFTAGLDVRIFAGVRPDFRYDLLLSLGVRRWYVGPARRADFRLDEGGMPDPSDRRRLLGMWIPLASLTLAIDNTSRAQAND